MNQLRLDDRVSHLVASAGGEMHALVRELYPFTRSITGPGLRATVQRLARVFPLEITEVSTGTQVFDWSVPNEWSIDEAYLEHESGRRFADLQHSNLHVMGYSVPVDRKLKLAELREHLHSLPEHPDWIPFRTSFYNENWGFCLTDRDLQLLPEGEYRAVIRSRLAPGSLTLAEGVHHGTSDEEILVFAHDCHPSLANDNLSGLVVAIHLAAFLRQHNTRYTYRFLFAPATIGSITWMATNEAKLKRIRHGLVLSLLGNGDPLHYKKSRVGGLAVDRAAAHVLRTEFPGSRFIDFSPWGYDERQFCSPGTNLPIGGLTRVPNGEFEGAHTSADNPDAIRPESLAEAWLACLKIFEALEANERYQNLQPKGEPQLGRRGLYRSTGGHYSGIADRQMALLWMLNQSDGSASLLDIAEKSGLPAVTLAQAAADLMAVGLLAPWTQTTGGVDVRAVNHAN